MVRLLDAGGTPVTVGVWLLVLGVALYYTFRGFPSESLWVVQTVCGGGTALLWLRYADVTLGELLGEMAEELLE